MPRSPSIGPSSEEIGSCIRVLRGEKVLLDADLARLYGVTTRRLNEQVRRNAPRFPQDFAFRLSNQELRHLMSQFATSSGQGGLRKNPTAFTEHGAIMVASILNTPRAVQVSVFVVRAFVRLRDAFNTHGDLAKKLEELERKTEALAHSQDSLAENMRTQLRQVIETLRLLMTPLEPRRRSIGFVRQD